MTSKAGLLVGYSQVLGNLLDVVRRMYVRCALHILCKRGEFFNSALVVWRADNTEMKDLRNRCTVNCPLGPSDAPCFCHPGQKKGVSDRGAFDLDPTEPSKNS